MKIYVASLFVGDQVKALAFYTDIMGFQVKHDEAAGDHRWLTLVSPQDPDGVELLLEPSVHPAVQPYRDALRADGIPATSFQVSDLDAEYERLTAAGVTFRQDPVAAGPVRMAILDDTCGNWIQLIEMGGAD